MKSDLVKLVCDYCGNYETFDVRSPAETVLPIISKWKGVMDGDQPPGQADSHRWYDSRECLLAGEQKHDMEKKAKAEEVESQEQQIIKANAAMKAAGYMKN